MELSKPKITNQAEAIKHFIEKMDIEMIDAFLENNKTYQDFEKCIFISKLQQAFEKFANLGNTYLVSVEGNCNYCDKTKTGFTFMGNHSNHYMNIIFDTAENKINDLYECSNFKNKEIIPTLNERIFINKIII